MYLFILILGIIFGFGIGILAASLKLTTVIEEYEEEIFQLKEKIKQN